MARQTEEEVGHVQGLSRADDDEGERIPDLSQLPKERWRDALRPLSRNGRIRSQSTVAPKEVMVVMAIIGELLLEEGAVRARAISAGPARMPSGDPPPNETRRQVNFRLGEGEHARLAEAARLFGMRPNVLARVLTVRGVDRALREARRDE
jgi:hypothetical protein